MERGEVRAASAELSPVTAHGDEVQSAVRADVIETAWGARHGRMDVGLYVHRPTM